MIDYNNCVCLNLIEKEQTDNNKNHACMKYCPAVFHRTQNNIHSPYLYPCLECEFDDYKFYIERKMFY